MCTYDDFDGVYFSCQANRLLHPNVDRYGEIIVIDNNPDSVAGQATKRFCESTKFIRYFTERSRTSTAIRTNLFTHAESDIIICIDSHVLLHAGAIDAVVEYLSKPTPHQPKLLQGPIVWDNLKMESVAWDDHWTRSMQGCWRTSQRLSIPEAKSFEIPNMGLGAFAARKDEWLGINPLFRGFGGEEGYLHRKYRRHGGISVSLPAFKWTHRFPRPNGCNYSNKIQDRIFNYFIGSFELGEPPDRIIEYFAMKMSEWEIKSIFEDAKRCFKKSSYL